MTAIAANPLVRIGADKRERLSVRAVEKVRPQAHFNGEYDRRKEPPCWVCEPYRRRRSSQSETEEDASFRDSPLLKSEFAAQVLGQALGENKPSPSAASAYRQTVVLLPLLDKNV